MDANVMWFRSFKPTDDQVSRYLQYSETVAKHRAEIRVLLEYTLRTFLDASRALENRTIPIQERLQLENSLPDRRELMAPALELIAAVESLHLSLLDTAGYCHIKSFTLWQKFFSTSHEIADIFGSTSEASMFSAIEKSLKHLYKLDQAAVKMTAKWGSKDFSETITWMFEYAYSNAQDDMESTVLTDDEQDGESTA